MAPKAASIAADLEKEFGNEVKISIGKLGQFEIFVDGVTLAKRTGKLFDKLKGKSIPSSEQVIDLINASA